MAIYQQAGTTSTSTKERMSYSPSSSSSSSLNIVICACFAANYIIGTGFLALPWAFYQAGWLFSLVCLAMVCWAENVASDFVLSAMARAEWVLLHERLLRIDDNDEEATRASKAAVPPFLKPPRGNEEEESSVVMRNDRDHDNGYHKQQQGYGSIVVNHSADYQNIPLSTPLPPLPPQPAGKSLLPTTQQQQPLLLAVGNSTQNHRQHHHHLLDLPEVCQLFLNQAGYATYALCVHLYLYGSLWMFVSVFGNAVATYLSSSTHHVDDGGGGDDFDTMMILDDLYVKAVLVLAVVVLPLSCLQLTEQKLLQVILTASRILLMVLMVSTPIVAFAADDDPYSSSNKYFGSNIQVSAAEVTPWLDWSGVHRMLPIVVCAGIFHFSIPALATDLGGNNKDQLSKVFAWTFVLVFVVYASIGVVDAWYFGGTIQQSSNVNWSHYHGGTGHPRQVTTTIVGEQSDVPWVDVAWWAKAISFFVTMFPAISVISIFPLHALVLGNSLMAIWYNDRIQEMQQNRWIVSSFRIVAAAPPLVGGLFIRELGTIMDYNGIFGLAIAFVFPSWLYLASIRRCPTTRTCYERQYGSSSKLVAKSLLVFGLVAQITVFSLLVWRG